MLLFGLIPMFDPDYSQYLLGAIDAHPLVDDNLGDQHVWRELHL